ncbi:Ubiquinone/menaquinone biosynthesis C-methylase UbiE [Pseudonocardia ammonioxydans]|uniref:Ubiquinone/menaquinone biosynthesis C-methylase UbiE n=1 Tax=Pseudonocardia ammonioxydans TaxID=260086 RepID=A0A1I4XNY3_PSUAM|nr:class I SAM-dependent methyltransferase [Pseudonocardia ammonioxydans]SFN27541.1 Ubiquinone/menaquinone biosynthesis C-methylase UbiE [Pseudonocardia ammonioxydans]
MTGGGAAAPVDPSNRRQADSWDGPGGDFWTANADRFDEGVAAYRAPFRAAAAIGETAHVLDVGCGTGQTTRDAARAASSGSALGVDLSAGMVELARRRAEFEGVPNVSFEQADAQVHRFPDGAADIAISRHGAMFFGDPVAAFTNIGRALRPDGRLVLLTWQPFDQQEWLSSFVTVLADGGPVPVPPSDAPSPFALSDPGRVRGILDAAGFTDVQLDGVRESMYIGPDTEDALRFVAGQQAGMLDELGPGRRARALEALRADLDRHRGDRGVVYDSAAWLVRARRR